MNEEQRAAVQGLKDLILDTHVLAVPDEAAAILAANSWQTGSVPEGRPYEGGADTSGLATGGVFGQACRKTGKLLVLMYYSGPLSPSQQKWHPFAQEFTVYYASGEKPLSTLGGYPASCTQTMEISYGW